MRISTNMAITSFAIHQQRLNAELATVQEQVITQQAVNRPSDDPLVASQILDFSSAGQRQEQVVENLQFARDFLSEADVALDDVTTHLDRIKELTLGAINTISLPDEREAVVTELDAIMQSLFGIGNKKYLDMYIFGGQALDTPPLTQELGGIRYQGSVGSLTARLSVDQDEAFSLTADDVFTMLSSRVLGGDLAPAITSDTRIDELNGANDLGVRLGTLRFVENTASRAFSVDLSSATSIGQVIDLINRAAAVAGSDMTAQINDAGTGLAIVPGSSDVSLTTLDNGQTARDLGLTANTPTNDIIVGEDLQRRVSPTTRLTDLFGGAGLDLTETFLIRNGPREATIDLSVAETVQDVMQIINQADLGVRTEVTAGGRGLQVISEISGTHLTIEENGGTLATQLGLRSLGPMTELAALNFGAGVRTIEGQDDFEIVTRDGQHVAVNLDSALTVQDALDVINDALAAAGVTTVTAEMATVGNGISINDTSSGTADLQVLRIGDSVALDDLGLTTEALSDGASITGADVGAVRVNGVFTALEDLRRALLESDERGMGDAVNRIDGFITSTARVRGQVGAQVRGMESRIDQTQAAVDATNELLVDVQGVSLEEALVRFQTVQNALQASLLAGSQSLNLSLLNFLQ